MSLALGLLLLALLGAPLLIAILRSTELFVLRAKQGKFALVRGRMPPELLSDLDDIAQREGLDGLELRVIVEGGSPRALFTGKERGGTEQQLRNVIGRFRLAQIRSGRLRKR